MSIEWAYDERTCTHVFGCKPTDGGGCFKDEVDGKWYGNVVIEEHSTVYGLGPYDSMQQAKTDVECKYNNLKRHTLI